MPATKSSRYRGVTLFRPTGKWRSQISADGKTTSLGCAHFVGPRKPGRLFAQPAHAKLAAGTFWSASRRSALLGFLEV